MIHNYIKEIIEKHSRLILPDLGAFLTKDINDKKVIFFNDVLKYNDGTLAGYVSEKEGIEISNALLKVSNFINEIKNSLISDSKFEILNLGMLYKDQKGYINFKPLEFEEKIEIINEPKISIIENTTKSESTTNDDILEMVTDSKEISNIKTTEEEISTSEITHNDEILEIEIPVETPKEVINIEEKPIEKIEVVESIIEEPKVEEKVIVEVQNTGNLVEFNNVVEPTITEKKEIIEEKIVEKKPELKKPVKDKKTIEKDLKKVANQKPKKSLKPLIIVAAIVIPLIILGAVGYVFKEKVVELVHGFAGKSEHKKEIVKVTKKVKVNDGETTTTTDSVVTDSNGLNEEIKSETVTKTEEVAENTVKEEPKEVAEQPSAKLNNNNSGDLKFHAIAGSFATTKEAEKFMNKLITEGYNSQILDSGNGKIRVTYNSFSTKQEATAEVGKLTAQGKQSWVLNQ